MLRRIRSHAHEALIALGLVAGAGVLVGILWARHGERATAPSQPSATQAPPTRQPPSSPAAPQELRVTALSATSATISWRTAGPTVAHVALGPPTLGPTRWLPATPSAAKQEVTLNGLAVARTYRVWVTSATADGAREQATVDLAPAVPTGTVTASAANETVLLDGQPWFPFLVYGPCSAHYASNLEAGITLFAENPCGGLETQLAALQGKALSAAVAGQESPDSPDSSSLVGSFYPDEADAHGYTGALLPQLPAGLRVLTLTSHFYSGAAQLPDGRSVYPSLVSKADFVGFDLYPLQGWCRASAIADVYSAQRELVRLASGRPTFQWIETSGMNCATDSALAVTPATVRAESWLAIAGGARGLGFFPGSWSGDIGGAIAGVADEVAAFMPALLTPQRQTHVSPADSPVRAAAWEEGGTFYVAAVNTGQAGVRATVDVAGLEDRSFQVLLEARGIGSSRGSIRDDFGPLAVHLYVAAPPGA